MKKFLVLLLALILGGTGGYFAYKYLANRSAQNKSSSEANAKSLASYNEPFQWGVTMRPSALGNYQPEIWRKQLKKAYSLGTHWARVSWDYENPEPFTRNDDVLKIMEDYEIQPVMIIEQNPKDKNGDNYKDGYDDGFTIASHYKGKVRYYQMANEGGAETIKEPTLNGQDESQYDEEKYKNLKDYLKGLSEGIAKADPEAWRIVSSAYTHTGYLDKLTKDKIGFDMIGIDWYDWMGPVGEKKMDDGQLFIDKLKSYNKPLTFMEVNAVPKGATKNSKSKKIVDEDKQSDFIAETAKWAWENKDYVKGFFVLELIDNVNNDSDNAEYFGIVAATKSSSGSGIPGEPRKAYYTYQELIKKYSGE